MRCCEPRRQELIIGVSAAYYPSFRLSHPKPPDKFQWPSRSQQYISGLAQGQRNPPVVTLYELAWVLGVKPIDLLSEAELIS